MIRLRGKKKRYSFLIILILLCGLAILLLRKPPEKKPAGPAPRIPEEIETVKPEKSRKPLSRIAVIIDDVGYDADLLEEYTRFQGKLSFSVLPFLSRSASSAKILHNKGFEILLHIPMEPLTYPEANPGEGALFTSDSKQEVERKITTMLMENPYAVGANNHMGSKATQDCDLMGWTMEILKKKDLFFIDSVTVGTSCAYRNARVKKVPAARRDVFLDNEDDFDAISLKFEELKEIAHSRGTAIGIGHIHKTQTLRVLESQLPTLEQDGFILIYASEALLN